MDIEDRVARLEDRNIYLEERVVELQADRSSQRQETLSLIVSDLKSRIPKVPNPSLYYEIDSDITIED